MKYSFFSRHLTGYFPAILTGILLYLSFPPFALAGCAWFALVPLLLRMAIAAERFPFREGFAAGVVFWMLTLSWISKVTFTGYALLALYCAFYPAVFCWLSGRLLRSRGARPHLMALFIIPVLWVGLEYVRGVLATGFPWNEIGVSQFANAALIQSADWGGVGSISWILILMNTGIVLTLADYIHSKGRRGHRPHWELLVPLLIVALMVNYGINALRKGAGLSNERSVSVSLIQPSIPQSRVWEREQIDLTYERLNRLTKSAAHGTTPDVIIWPETVLPELLRDSERARAFLYEQSRYHIPLMIGMIDYGLLDSGHITYYNASALLDAQGRLSNQYEKQHLVLLGEYIPLANRLSFLRALSTRIGNSFSPGRKTVVMQVENVPSVGMAPLICFEDALPYLARRAVKSGARLLVNQTNDGWFDGTAGAEQHLAHAVFRCIENRRPMVRAANSGITCYIDRKGSVRRRLAPCTQGFLTTEILLLEQPVETVYTKRGPIFGQACGIMTLCFALFVAAGASRRRS